MLAASLAQVLAKELTGGGVEQANLPGVI